MAEESSFLEYSPAQSLAVVSEVRFVRWAAIAHKWISSFIQTSDRQVFQPFNSSLSVLPQARLDPLFRHRLASLHTQGPAL